MKKLRPRISALALAALVAAPPTESSANVPDKPTQAPTAILYDAKADLAQARKMPEGAERWIAEAQALYYLARDEKDADARDRLLLEGAEAAERARAKTPDLPAALEYWVANMATHASHHPNLAALRLIPRLESALKDMLRVAPNYDGGAADRGLAGLYLNAPGWISIGSMRKAKEHVLEAMRRFPDYPANLIAYAEFLARDGEKSKARDLARAALKSPELAQHPRDAKLWAAQAQKVLDEVGG